MDFVFVNFVVIVCFSWMFQRGVDCIRFDGVIDPCDTLCECFTLNNTQQLLVVDCSGRRLRDVPENLPNDTHYL